MHLSEDAFRQLPAPPETLDVAALLVRLVDGLGFRYRWATEGLRDDDGGLRPSDGQMSLLELMAHVRDLVGWCSACAAASVDEPPRYDVGPVGDVLGLRQQTLDALVRLRATFGTRDPAELARLRLVGRRGGDGVPFLHMLNGPLADALTHVGQIAAWRRFGGRPGPAADVFRGRPPRE